jgi:hypothetical protein
MMKPKTMMEMTAQRSKFLTVRSWPTCCAWMDRRGTTIISSRHSLFIAPRCGR